MKHLLLTLVTLLSLTTLVKAQVPADHKRMIDLLETAGVKAIGRKEKLEANINCALKLKSGELTCMIIAGDHEIGNQIFKEFTGPSAQEISAILKTFGVLPEGKRLRQHADVLCQLPRRNTVQERSCQFHLYNDWYQMP